MIIKYLRWSLAFKRKTAYRCLQFVAEGGRRISWRWRRDFHMLGKTLSSPGCGFAGALLTYACSLQLPHTLQGNSTSATTKKKSNFRTQFYRIIFLNL